MSRGSSSWALEAAQAATPAAGRGWRQPPIVPARMSLAANPFYGDGHAYSVFLTTGAERQTVCAYGINNGPGTNPRLGCKTV